jgi:dihydrofolate reductase
MLIKTHIGISVDGFVATADGRPALLALPDFVPGQSHGYPEFIADCGAVVMGRTTFEPALKAPSWPWPNLSVYVLTSRPLPSDLPASVTAASSATGLLARMRADELGGDIHLVGGPKTIRAFHEIGALDRLEVVVLPLMLATGIPLSLPDGNPLPLSLDSQRTFSDGSVELAYLLPH